MENKIMFENEEYTYIKQDESIEFICKKCKKRKIAKKYAMTFDNKKFLCNGCYGNLVSKRV